MYSGYPQVTFLEMHTESAVNALGMNKWLRFNRSWKLAPAISVEFQNNPFQIKDPKMSDIIFWHGCKHSSITYSVVVVYMIQLT